MKSETLRDVAAVMTALAQVNTVVPASSVYIGLGCDIGRYETCTNICARCEWIVKTSTTLTITEKGKQFAATLE